MSILDVPIGFLGGGRDVPGGPGEPEGPVQPCGPPPDVHEPDTQLWTTNRCATFIQTPHVRPSEQYPRPGVLLRNFKPGYTELVPVAPIRAMERERHSDNSPNGELCSYHLAKFAVAPNGRSVSLMCSEPDRLTGDGKRNVVGHAVVMTAEMKEGMEHAKNLVREGWTYFVGAYPTPPWVEANLISPRHLCGQPV